MPAPTPHSTSSQDSPAPCRTWRTCGSRSPIPLSGIPILTAEMARLQAELIRTRLDRANFAAAARATIAACRNGDRDPLSYLHDELEAQGFTGERGQA